MTKVMVMVIVLSRFLEGEMKNIMRERKVINLYSNDNLISIMLFYRFLKTKDLTWIHVKIGLGKQGACWISHL